MNSRITVGNMQFKPYLDASKIDEVVADLARSINKDYEGKQPIFLSILNGAFRFTADLSKYIDIDCEWQFVKLSSYDGLSTTGQVKISDSMTRSVEGRHIIILEDIIDTGITMHYFLEFLRQQNPASVAIASLLVKYEAIQKPMHIEYVGISIPNRFVVGYGLDYNEEGRNLNDIWQLDDEEA